MVPNPIFQLEEHENHYTVVAVQDIILILLISSAVDCGFESQWSKTRFSAKHIALMSKDKDWLAQSQNNVSE